MRGIIIASCVVVAVTGAVALRSHAEAAAPPVKTATPTPSVIRSPTPTATSTPVTSMFIWADVIVNAAPSFDRVSALIANVECASGMPIIPVDTEGTNVDLIVPSAAERPGCGTPGAIVHFLIGGRPARGTVVWQPGAFVHVSLIVGPDWASYYGRYTWQWTPGGPLFEVVAVIDGRECGRQGNPLRGLGPEWDYGMRVLPDELRSGCGRPGSVVHFELRAGDVLLARARETASWQPLALQELNLTFVPIRVLPSTGVGKARPKPEHNAFALAAAGVVCIVAGAARSPAKRRPGDG